MNITTQKVASRRPILIYDPAGHAKVDHRNNRRGRREEEQGFTTTTLIQPQVVHSYMTPLSSDTKNPGRCTNQGVVDAYGMTHEYNQLVHIGLRRTTRETTLERAFNSTLPLLTRQNYLPVSEYIAASSIIMCCTFVMNVHSVRSHFGPLTTHQYDPVLDDHRRSLVESEG